MLTKKDILAANDIQTQIVPIPEWGGEVMVYGLTSGEKDLYEEGLVTDGKISLQDATARLCVMCLKDDTGKPIFSLGDIKALSGKASLPLERIAKVAQKLSGLGKGDLEEMVKNSEKTQKSGSD